MTVTNLVLTAIYSYAVWDTLIYLACMYCDIFNLQFMFYDDQPTGNNRFPVVK